jgi:amino acid transporter
VYRAGIGGVVGSGGVLASTGANVTWWIVFAIITIITGVVLTRFTRHRPQSNEN